MPQQLTGIQDSLSQDRASVLAADNTAVLGAAIAHDRRDIAGAVARLGGLTPPSSMQTEQRGLITALTSYGSELGSMATETSEGQVCLGWAALAQR